MRSKKMKKINSISDDIINQAFEEIHKMNKQQFFNELKKHKTEKVDALAQQMHKELMNELNEK